MIIAFIGNDGSGKTTVARILQTKLIASGRKTRYISAFEHCFLDGFKKLFGGSTAIDIDRLQREYADSKRGRTNLLFFLWTYLVFLDCLCMFFKYFFCFGEIVIFDRYFYDYVVSFRNLGVNTWLEERLFLILPKPDNCYVFDASPEVAYERKKATHISEINYYEKQRERYLCFANYKHISVINSDNTTAEDIAQRIFNQINKGR